VERDPDRLEKAKDEVYVVNVEVAHTLAKLAAELGACIVHISTGDVFDGGMRTKAKLPYDVGARTRPLSYYAQTKRESELAVLAVTAARPLVIRLPVLYALDCKSFSESATLNVAETLFTTSLKDVDDWSVHFPTCTADVATILCQLIALKVAPNRRRGMWHADRARGVYHVSQPVPMTNYATALAMGRVLGVDTSLLRKGQQPEGEPRPRVTQLKCTRTWKALGHVPSLMPPEAGLRAAFNAQLREAFARAYPGRLPQPRALTASLRPETSLERWAWTLSACARGDGVPAGMRSLDVAAGFLNWYTGMTEGDPSRFRRARWDMVDRAGLVPAPGSARGVAWSEAPYPSIAHSDPPVRVRRYTPVRVAREAVVIWLHGGGMCLQRHDSGNVHAGVLDLAVRLGAEVLSVDYRLAPEDPFPAGLQDAYGALIWAHRAPDWEGRPFVLAGDSAGSNLALVLAMLAARGVDPDLRPAGAGARGVAERLAHLLLLYPWLMDFANTSGEEAPDTARADALGASASGGVPGCVRNSRTPASYYLLSRGMQAFFVKSYLGSAGMSLLHDWRVAPLRGAPLEGMPSATIICGALDPLAPSVSALASALREGRGNGPVAEVTVPNAGHGFLSVPPGASMDSSTVEGVWHTAVAALDEALSRFTKIRQRSLGS